MLLYAAPYLHCKLGKLALVCVGIEGAPPEVSVQVVEDDLVPRDHHTTHQAEEPPVLDVDTAIGV